MKISFRKLIRNPFILNPLLAIIISCFLVWGTLRWLEIYTKHNIAVVVPNVRGMQIDEAASHFKSHNLRFNVIDSVFSKDVKPGAIVELLPEIGSKVKEGRIVFVTVNALTSQMAAIPEVEDLSFRQAYAQLRARGFEKINIEYIEGDFKDLAICVELNGKELQKGQYIPITSPLLLKVSSGDIEISLDSLNRKLNEIPIESLDNEEESWF